MRITALLCMVGLSLVPFSARAEEDVVDKKRPIIVHVPVTTVLRGQPADVSANINSQGGVITSVTAQVKLAIAGKPIVFPMNPGTGSLYDVLIPVSAIKGINRFWYFIHSLDSNGRMADTIWHEVRIIDGGDLGGGGAAAGGGGGHKALWIGGGLLAVGGVTAAIIDHNNDDGGGGGTPVVAQSPAPPKKKSNNSNNDDDDDDDDVVDPPPCVFLSGSESVSYKNLDPFLDSNPIQILVCNTCPNALISATASWGPTDSISGYNNPNCSDADLALVLELNKPRLTPPVCETLTINVFVNGLLVESLPWPDCLFY